MTELLTDLEILKEQILSERCQQELPGDTPLVTTARKLLLVGLLGRLPTNGHADAPQNTLPVPLSLSPVSPVETAPEVSIDTPGAVAPGESLAGETPEEVVATAPPPGDLSEPEAVVIPIDRERQPGSSGAIYEARIHVLTCLDKNRGVELRAVRNLTGWDAITASKFIRDIQDEYRQVQRQSPKTGRPLKGIRAGIDSLLDAVANAPDDEEEEEPEPGELESIEAEAGPETGTETGPKPSDKPRWWADSEARYCKTCKAVLPPKYKRSKAGNKQWESLFQYNMRSYCAEHSPKKGGRAKETNGND